MLWTIAETASRLAVSVRTVQRLLETGDLPTVRIRSRRLVHAEGVRAWIENQIVAHNEGARARMTPEKTSCENEEPTVTVSTNSRGRRIGTPAIPMRRGTAAAEVQARIAAQKQKRS